MTQVLIVDDDHSIVRMLRLALRISGYETLAAYDGREALASVEAEFPDAIVLDLNMPVMTGDEFLRIVRARGFVTPIIVMSADVRSDPRLRGADAFIRKPFRPDTILAAIQALTPRSLTPGDAITG
jgi:CheY-like chemotaxis protein